jgi:hypothetical protein
MGFLSCNPRTSLPRVALFLAVILSVFVQASGVALAAGGLYGSLNGTVIDSASKTPIAGASVVARSPSGTYTATTDGKGFFSIVGMNVDTYVVSVSAAQHHAVDIPGVIVFGDQINTVGTVALALELKTIAQVRSRSVSSAYQPSQTTDQYTVNSQQILQSTGKAASTDENSVLLSVPGVTLTNNTSPISSTVTIRGGAAAEVGYQYDGVPFKEPFLGGNGSNGLINGISSVQVVEGAGDATQGEVGAGVINVIPDRGYGAPHGLLDLEAGGPNFTHQVGFNYGFSTPNNRFSEFVSYSGQRMAPYYGYHDTPLNQFGDYFATTYLTNDQFTNNFFFKFGHNLNQQFQVLYTNVQQQGFGGTIGAGGVFDPSANPGALAYYPYDTTTQFLSALLGNLPLGGFTPSQYASLIGLGPGVPTTNNAIRNPQQNFSNQTVYLKFEYDNNLSSNTYLALRYYNWNDLQNTDNQYTLGPWGAGFPGISAWVQTGGQTVGTNLDIIHQFGSKLTLTLNGQYNVLYPQFNAYEPQLSMIGIAIAGLANPPAGADWLPSTTAGCAPGQCGYIYDYFCPGVAWTTGPAPSCLPRVPSWGIGYNKTTFQNWGSGIRLQFVPNDRIHLDIGLRDEGQVRHWFSQVGQLGQGAPATGCTVQAFPCPAGDSVGINNPFDVPSKLWTNEPTVLQPRGSVSWEIDPNDAVRFAYGRSAVFADAQTGGTPFHSYGLEPYLKVPAKPGSACGWANTPFGTTSVFPCASYGAQLYWQGDNVEAPDGENLPPAVYTNYDLSFNHQFKSGWGLRVTPFYKEGTSLPTYFELNPVLGIFAISNQGLNKTTGGELGLTTPQRAYGLSGFFTATYQNVLSTTPPFTSGETTVPTNSLATLALGDLYRAGYVSPFSLRVGAVENLKNGFSISPQLEYNVGFPYSIGNMIAGCIAFHPDGTCATFANLPQVDFAGGITPGASSLVGSAPGASISTNYYDPSYAGNIRNPNIAASRGTPATSVNGGILSHPNLYANLTLQYKHEGNTFGVQMRNLFGNAWINSVPAVNPWYQPVANGLSGPQTGYNSCVNQTGVGIRGCYPTVPTSAYAFTNGAYLLSNGNFTGTPAFGPIQPFTITFFYQRSL